MSRLRRIAVGKGKARVEMTGALAGALEDQILAAMGPLGEAVLQAAELLAEGAREHWPVATGASRAALVAGFRVDPARMSVVGTVFGAPYAHFIRWPGRRRIRSDIVAKMPPAEYDVTVVRKLWHSRKGTPYYRDVKEYRTKPPQGVTLTRGGVLQDLLRTPLKEAKAELKAVLPDFLTAILTTAEGERPQPIRWPKAGGTRRTPWSTRHPAESERRTAGWLGWKR